MRCYSCDGHATAFRPVAVDGRGSPAIRWESDSQSKRFWDEVNTSSIFPFLYCTGAPVRDSNGFYHVPSAAAQRHLALGREAAQVLMWALRLIPELPAPDEQANLDLSEPEILSHPSSFLNSAVLRPHAEIEVVREIWPSFGIGAAAQSVTAREGRPLLPDEQMTRQGLRSSPGHSANGGERRV